MSEIEQKVKEIERLASEQIGRADGLEKLNELRVSFLGKKGSLTQVLKAMKDVAPEDRPKVGKWVNDARAAIEARMEESKAALEEHIRSGEGHYGRTVQPALVYGGKRDFMAGAERPCLHSGILHVYESVVKALARIGRVREIAGDAPKYHPCKGSPHLKVCYT